MMAGSLMGDAPTKRMVVLSGPAVMKEIFAVGNGDAVRQMM